MTAQSSQAPTATPRLLGGDTALRPREVGTKAAALDAAHRAGAPVPPGFVLDCAAAARLRAETGEGGERVDGKQAVDAVAAALTAGVAHLEAATGLRFGDPKAPLLLAVRLSPETAIQDLAPAALWIGLDLEAAPPPATERRFWRSWAPLALGCDGPTLDDAVEDALEEVMEDALEGALEAALEDTLQEARADGAGRRAEREPDLDARAVAALRAAASPDGAAPPSPRAQLEAAVLGAALRWDDDRHRRRRAAAQAADGCAILVQAMAPEPAATGWARAADPDTGAATAMGRITTEVALERSLSAAGRETPLETVPDALRAEILRLTAAVEDALGPPQEVRFAICAPSGAQTGPPERPPTGRLRLLSTRPLRLSAQAAVEIAVRRAETGRISRAAALLAVEPDRLIELLHPTLAPSARRDVAARGLPASPGAACGALAFSADAAEAIAASGRPAILIRAETSPEDVAGMQAAAAVVTTRGGLTSHAAVIARGLGKPCVVGAVDARLDESGRRLIARDGRAFAEGDDMTVDGQSGALLVGALETRQPAPTGAFARMMAWADAHRRLAVRANADTPADAAAAGRLGVDGIGLCRTEHMFFEPARITLMREMILADGSDARRDALNRLLPLQRADFEQLFEIMERMVGQGAAAAPPVTIRLLDPPLHEFLPQTRHGLTALARAIGVPPEKVARRASELREYNPMLGKRGCRVGVAFPEIYEMQVRAIFEAALAVDARLGRAPRAEIMVPLVSAMREFDMLRDKIDAVAEAVRAEVGRAPAYEIGLMVETPRAALRAGPLGAAAAFFSFGTNDLTQMTYGLSRDDAARLMRDYVERGVFEADPFQSLDQEGVGELIRIAIDRGRAANPDLAIGLCGEHGGDPATISFCETAGFDYVSCSPYRAPIARLAAAQAALRAVDGDEDDERA